MPRSFYRQLLMETAMRGGKGNPPAEGKTREEVLAEREAKKRAKKLGRGTKKDESEGAKQNEEPLLDKVPKPTAAEKETPAIEQESVSETGVSTKPEKGVEKSREEILAERAAKKAEKKQGGKTKVKVEKEEKSPVTSTEVKPAVPIEPQDSKKEIAESDKSKAQLRAERRAKQEAQRAKKADSSAVKEIKIEKKDGENLTSPPKKEGVPKTKKAVVSLLDGPHKVKLFAHLYAQSDISLRVLRGVEEVHPSISRLGAQYKARVICGSNVRCLALLRALKQVISDYRTPANEELNRGLGSELTRSLAFLHRCRPISVSMSNAIKHLRTQLTQSKGSEPEVKSELIEWVDTYVKDQLEKAAEAISISVRQKIADGDVILTYSYSSLIQKILMAAARENIRFRVIVVDGRPWLEGRELVRRLLLAKIPCTYILVNAVSFVMPEVTKILLGAHALLANGYVMSRCGSSQVALLGRAFNVPVLVCCETHKFSERVQTDSFVYNELGNPDELGGTEPKWHNIAAMTPLNLVYDVTPPDLVSAVVTELAILPCTSVPVILRIK